jgi:hypothetical protein
VQVHYDEGVANHIGPEPCAGIREDVGEASAGERAGQPLSRDRKLIPGADAVCVAEGICPRAPTQALGRPGVVEEPGTHACSMYYRDPIRPADLMLDMLAAHAAAVIVG